MYIKNFSFYNIDVNCVWFYLLISFNAYFFIVITIQFRFSLETITNILNWSLIDITDRDRERQKNIENHDSLGILWKITKFTRFVFDLFFGWQSFVTYLQNFQNSLVDYMSCLTENVLTAFNICIIFFIK